VDRIVWAIACGCAYVGACFGGKAKPADLIPEFRSGPREAESREVKRARVMAFFDGLLAAPKPPEANGGG
jgi:hypothetical protein